MSHFEDSPQTWWPIDQSIKARQSRGGDGGASVLGIFIVMILYGLVLVEDLCVSLGPAMNDMLVVGLVGVVTFTRAGRGARSVIPVPAAIHTELVFGFACDMNLSCTGPCCRSLQRKRRRAGCHCRRRTSILSCFRNVTMSLLTMVMKARVGAKLGRTAIMATF
jgi:hypothetical protein